MAKYWAPNPCDCTFESYPLCQDYFASLFVSEKELDWEVSTRLSTTLGSALAGGR